MATDWDYRVREAAQGSLGSAHRLLQCLSGQRLGGSAVEVGSAAKEAIAGFRSLVSLLEGSLPASHRKRVRRGPLPSSKGIDPAHLMDRGDPPKVAATFVLTGPGGLQRQRQAQVPLEKNKTALRLDGCRMDYRSMSTMPSRPTSFVSSVSVDGGSNSSMGNQLLNYYCYSSSSAQTSVGGSSSFYAWKRKHLGEEGSVRCTMSTGGCHCSKRRQGIPPGY